MNRRRSIIAVIDDDLAIRRALQRLLVAAAFDVKVFAGGAEFLESLGTWRPDCIVMDLQMPGMSGFDLQAHLTRTKAAIPIVVITGHDAAETQKRAMDAGAAAYLVKPVDSADLFLAIQRAIAPGNAEL